MDNETFMKIVRDQIGTCLETLEAKEVEYSAGTDRLDQFKIASKMQGMHPLISLSGMMIKHTTSIYKMIAETIEGRRFPAGVWEEKITDHINYLLLLRAFLDENPS